MDAPRHHSRPFHTLARSGIGFALGLALGGCQPDRLVNSAAPDTTVPRIVATQLQFDAARMGVADAASRLAPAMAHFADARALDASLAAIANAVDLRDARALRNGLDRVDAVLTRMTAADDGSATADLDALHMSLGDASRLLTASSSPDFPPAARNTP